MIVDGHNDLVLRVWRGEAPRHLDLAAAADAGFAGGFFALFVGPPGAEPEAPPYSLPLPDPIPRDEARRVAHELAAVLERLDVTIVRRADEILPGRVNAIMHLEGAEPLGPDLLRPRALVRPGAPVGRHRRSGRTRSPRACRSVSRSPGTGPGLTAAGFGLVRACNRLGVLVDVSHLNEAGFWDVVRTSDAPIVATHSNAHALCASSRNLTDEQLDAVARSGGVVA